MARELTVTVIRPPGLEALIADLGSVEARMAEGEAFRDFAPDFQQDLIANSGDSGRFATGWAVQPLPRGGGLNIDNTFEFAGFVERGTAPHIIRPVTAPALSWIPKGGTKRVFAKLVHHPGFVGREVFGVTIAEDQDELIQSLFESAHRILTDYGAD